MGGEGKLLNKIQLDLYYLVLEGFSLAAIYCYCIRIGA